MVTFLLVLKVLGMVLSGASIIGSRRLKEFEAKLRVALQWQNIDAVVNKTKTSLAQPITTRLKKIEHSFEGYVESQVVRDKRFHRELLSESIRQPSSNLRRAINLVAELFLLPIVLIGLILAPIGLFLVIILVYILVYGVGALIYILLLLTRLVVNGLTELLKISIWIVSRPYVWLDLQVKKRGVESTLIVIGMITAIAAEIIDNYAK
jgi:hypothetical protein